MKEIKRKRYASGTKPLKRETRNERDNEQIEARKKNRKKTNLIKKPTKSWR
jgi:hypothetical protein